MEKLAFEALSGYYQPPRQVKVYPNNSCNEVFGIHTHTNACSQLNNGTFVPWGSNMGAVSVMQQPVQQPNMNNNLAYAGTASVFGWDISSEPQEFAYRNATRIDGDIITEAAIDFYRRVQEESISENNINDPFNPWMQAADELVSFFGNITDSKANFIYKLINYAKDHPYLSILAITLALATTICIFGHTEQKTVNQSNCSAAKSCVINNDTTNNLYLFYSRRK